MPRKARIDAPGALRHIIIRGIKRQRIFSLESNTYPYSGDSALMGKVSISLKRGENIAKAEQLKLEKE